MKPYLRDHVPTSFADVPDVISYEAGYLVTKNAGWRNVRPVIDAQKCVGCLNCYLYSNSKGHRCGVTKKILKKSIVQK